MSVFNDMETIAVVPEVSEVVSARKVTMAQEHSENCGGVANETVWYRGTGASDRGGHRHYRHYCRPTEAAYHCVVCGTAPVTRALWWCSPEVQHAAHPHSNMLVLLVVGRLWHTTHNTLSGSAVTMV